MNITAISQKDVRLELRSESALLALLCHFICIVY